MSEFIDLLRESVIVQGVLTIGVIATCCYLWVRGEVVPPELLQVLWAVLAFWMGGKVQSVIQRGRR